MIELWQQFLLILVMAAIQDGSQHVQASFLSGGAIVVIYLDFVNGFHPK